MNKNLKDWIEYKFESLNEINDYIEIMMKISNWIKKIKSS